MKRYIKFFFAAVTVTVMCILLSLCSVGAESDSSDIPLSENIDMTLYSLMLDSALECKDTVSVGTYGYTQAQVADTFHYMILEEPELFFLSNHYGISYSGDTVIDIKLYYRYDTSEIENLRTEFKEKVEQLTSKVDPAWNDFEKLIYLHDLICLTYTYDDSLTVANAYDFIKGGAGVCQAYTLLLDALLEEVGIESHSVNSTEMNHVWNEVLINGAWYHVDATWDDTHDDSPVAGGVGHTYFMLSTAALIAMPKRAYNDISALYDCTSAVYDGSDIQSTSVAAAMCDGLLYTLTQNGLCTVNTANGSCDVRAEISNKWFVSSTSYYTGVFSSLAEYDGTLIYNTHTGIIMYNPQSGTAYTVRDIAVPFGAVFGFSVLADTVTFETRMSPTEPAMESYSADLRTLNVSVTYQISDLTVTVQTCKKGDRLSLPSLPMTFKNGEKTYVITSWLNYTDGYTVTDDMTVKGAEGDAVLFTVTWMINGVAHRDVYAVSELPTCVFDTAKPSTEDTVFTFSGWSPAVSPVTADVTYTAQYDESRNYFYAYWNIEGAVYRTRHALGEDAAYAGQTPQKPAYDKYEYVFDRWSFVSLDDMGDSTYRAEFRAVEKYAVGAAEFTSAVADYRQIKGAAARYAALVRLHSMSAAVNPNMDGVSAAKAKLPVYVNEYNEYVRAVNSVISEASKAAEKTCGVSFSQEEAGSDEYVIWISKENLLYI